jgi:hypothetical protein
MKWVLITFVFLATALSGRTVFAVCEGESWAIDNANSEQQIYTAQSNYAACLAKHSSKSCRAEADQIDSTDPGTQANHDAFYALTQCYISGIENPTPASRQVPVAGPSEVEICIEKSDAALNDCDMSENSEYKDLINAADQAAKGLQQSAQSSIAAACSQLATISQGANGFLVSYKVTCTTSVNSCQSACSTAEEKAKSNNDQAMKDAIKGAKANCAKAAQRLAGLDNQVAGIAKTQATSQQCAQFVTKNDSLLQVTLAQCKQNPSLQGCAALLGVDCVNPSVASTNLTCICQKTPNDARCGYGKIGAGSGVLGGGTDSTGAGTGIGGSKIGPPDLNDSPGSDPFAQLPEIPGSAPGSGGAPMGAGGSAGMGGSKGANQAPQKKGPAQKSQSKIDTNVLGGYRGGGGVMGFVNRVADAIFGEPKPRRPAGKSNDVNAVDYQKFLPNGQNDPRRDLASQNYPDGITGPFSDNWKKMNNQFIKQASTLLPPD